MVASRTNIAGTRTRRRPGRQRAQPRSTNLNSSQAENLYRHRISMMNPTIITENPMARFQPPIPGIG